MEVMLRLSEHLEVIHLEEVTVQTALDTDLLLIIYSSSMSFLLMEPWSQLTDAKTLTSFGLAEAAEVEHLESPQGWFLKPMNQLPTITRLLQLSLAALMMQIKLWELMSTG